MFTLTWATDVGARTLGLDEITADSLLTAAGDLGIDTYRWDDTHVYRLVAALAGGVLNAGEGVVVCNSGTMVVRREH